MADGLRGDWLLVFFKMLQIITVLTNEPVQKPIMFQTHTQKNVDFFSKCTHKPLTIFFIRKINYVWFLLSTPTDKES